VLSTTHTSSNITTVMTYYLPLLNPQGGRLVGVLEVSDWALVDNVLVAINHSVLSPSYNNLSAVSSVYKLVLHFPAFNSSLAYDPSLNLGIILAHQASSSGPNTWLVVGVTVGISVGVGLVMVGSMAVGIVRSKRRWSKLKSALDKGSFGNTPAPLIRNVLYAPGLTNNPLSGVMLMDCNRLASL